jgi:hypothetical protein
MELELEILERTSARRGESTIHLAGKSGMITLSADFCRAAGVKPGDAAAIAKDPKREKDWYVVIFSDPKDARGIQIREKQNTTSLVFNSAAWAQQFIDQFGKKDQASIRVAMGTAPTEILGGKAKAFAILTKSLES